MSLCGGISGEDEPVSPLLSLKLPQDLHGVLGNCSVYPLFQWWHTQTPVLN